MSTSDLFSRCINREEDPQYSREYWVAMRAWYAGRALTAWSDYHPWREAVRCPLPVPEGEVWQARLGRGVGVVDLQEGPGLVMCGHGRIWLARERGLSVFPFSGSSFCVWPLLGLFLFGVLQSLGLIIFSRRMSQKRKFQSRSDS